MEGIYFTSMKENNNAKGDRIGRILEAGVFWMILRAKSHDVNIFPKP